MPRLAAASGPRIGPKPKFVKPPGGGSRWQGERGSGSPPLAPWICTKKPRLVAGFFRLERLHVCSVVFVAGVEQFCYVQPNCVDCAFEVGELTE